jgi:hypothetical protein
LYACKIKETANGGWRRACGEARETFEVITQRSVEENGEIGEAKRTARDVEDEAQEAAKEKATIERAEAV